MSTTSSSSDDSHLASSLAPVISRCDMAAELDAKPILETKQPKPYASSGPASVRPPQAGGYHFG